MVTKMVTLAKTKGRSFQFGVNGGGPVWLPFYNGRNQTFFFGRYEEFRQVTGAGLSGLAITPTPAQLAGNLSNLSSPIFNPVTTRPDPAHARLFLRSPFPSDTSP